MASGPPGAADLTGRVAVVTGAAHGVGRATVRAFAAAGAAVVLADLDGAEGAEAARECGGRFVATDVALPHALELLFAVAEHERGGVDVLVNAAGHGTGAAALDRNLRGPMEATRLAAAAMRARGGGAVVNVAAIAGIGLDADPEPELAAAMAGLIRFTAASAGLAAQGVSVSAVCPAHAIASARVAGLILELVVHPDAPGRIVVWPEDAEPYALG